MMSYETPYRVCYADTDRMGIMYYGNYPRLYEIGRTDMIRSIWKSYREVEESGIILPVRLLHAVYHKPANYDELLTIRTIIKEIPILGWFVKHGGRAPVVQQSLVLGQATMFPTINDVIDLLTVPFSIPAHPDQDMQDRRP